MKNAVIGEDKIPAAALGTWAWGTGLNGGDSVFGDFLSEKELKPVFDKAMENGLILWDTAAVYGMGASETILGKLIREGSTKPVLSTKFSPMPLRRRSSMAKSLAASLSRLGTDAADIYWIHNPSNVKKWTGELIPLLKSGIVRHAGVSNHNLNEIRLADRILKDAGFRLDGVQNHYSLLYRSSEEGGVLDWCRENGVCFFAYMVLEQGALSGHYDAQHPFPPKTRRAKAFNSERLKALEPLLEKMRETGAKHDAGPAEIAEAWALAKGTVPILGVTKPHHVNSVLKAMEMELSADEVADLETAAKNTGVSVKASWEKVMENRN